ncbi:MAG: divalent-cation tolerance protein CutA [Mariniblastus sp.]
MNSLIVVTTTSDDRTVLQEIASHLVKQRLAACCQISGPIESVYLWPAVGSESKVETSQEWTCSIKTQKRFYLKVEQAILEFHNYETPQIVAIDICAVSEPYEKWIGDCLD